MTSPGAAEFARAHGSKHLLQPLLDTSDFGFGSRRDISRYSTLVSNRADSRHPADQVRLFGDRTRPSVAEARVSPSFFSEDGGRADGIVQSMLLHARGRSGERRKFVLNELTVEALSLAYHRRPRTGP
jgi:hypothetical protein